MVEKIAEYIKEHALLVPGKPVIVGLSGGADSVALLAVLVRLGYPCVAAHCNFHLRGDESDRDEEFSHLYAKSLQIPFVTTGFNTHEYAGQEHISMEMAARDLRYEWFESLRKEHHAQAIAVAHHQDDQIETILLNLARGTGIRGLRGMRVRNGFVVRPLLDCSREELIAWLAKEQLPFVTDSTNLSTDYKRNFIRHELIASFEKLNPSFRTTLARSAGYFSALEDMYDYMLAEVRLKAMPEGDRISIPVLLKYPSAETFLFELLKPYEFNRFVVSDIFQSLHKESGKVFESPGYRVIKNREELLICEKGKEEPDSYEIRENALFCEYPLKLSFRKIVLQEELPILKDKQIAYFDYDKISFPLTLRRWKKGDWFVPFGMKGRKKLSDYFSDRKFSIPEKEEQWILCSGNDIIWVVGERSDDRYRIDQQTNCVLIVKNFI
ncbi:MAG: tRNA lysidine(34) synthetase TilS [Tannerellaceae bacterium]|nr:tRNA lysidine(34) synthetase TilS [Tannerellaceae bacterium]